jgi:hypothetical protein
MTLNRHVLLSDITQPNLLANIPPLLVMSVKPEACISMFSKLRKIPKYQKKKKEGERANTTYCLSCKKTAYLLFYLYSVFA